MLALAIIILILAVLLVLLRFLKGPSTADRVVALDIIGIMGVSLMVILALYFQRSIYLDLALVFGLIGFLGSTLFGRYIENGV